MAPPPVDSVILGVKVTSSPLPFEHAQPMIPLVTEILSIAAADVGALVASGKLDLKGDLENPAVVSSLLPSLRNLGAFLDGKLERLAPKILLTTTVELDGEVWELMKPKDRSHVFDERPDLFLPCLVFAGKVTFARFFPGRARSGSGATGPSP